MTGMGLFLENFSCKGGQREVIANWEITEELKND